MFTRNRQPFYIKSWRKIGTSAEIDPDHFSSIDVEDLYDDLEEGLPWDDEEDFS